MAKENPYLNLKEDLAHFKETHQRWVSNLDKVRFERDRDVESDVMRPLHSFKRRNQA